MKKFFLLVILSCPLILFCQNMAENGNWIKNNYNKYIYKIPMSDGVLLHTNVYVPKDASKNNTYPIMLQRTCYSVAPYEDTVFPKRLGPSSTMMKEKYIFVYQDVRGRWMSEGRWTNVTPNYSGNGKKISIDESADTYSTIDFLIKKIPFNNGLVGMWGISYPGFYVVAGMIDAHPALKAVSPQAPVSDFFFDDFHRNGAFTQAYLFAFPVFGKQKMKPTSTSWYEDQFIEMPTKDGFQFQYELGALSNVNKYYKENILWQDVINHPNYDTFWQKRNILNHIKNIKPAVMTVGGWYDAEDLWGALKLFKIAEKNKTSDAYNTIVMGPFDHGGWAREVAHNTHSNIYFGDSISFFYQKNIEAVFFYHFLKGKADNFTGLPKAYMFNTGTKDWSMFEQWPPIKSKKITFYLNNKQTLSNQAEEGFVEFVSDPAKPVPYTEDNTTTMSFTPRNYMSEDQRFAARRPDVLVFETEPLKEDMTLASELAIHLKVSSNETDADWVVKLIDVYPGSEANHQYMPNKNIILSNYHQMVRSEMMRSRFRNSFETPEPLIPNQKTDIHFELQDVFHTFKKGHRIQIQVQSTWFPLMDRNPQKFVPNIYQALDSDFIKAIHKVYFDSYIEVNVMNN